MGVERNGRGPGVVPVALPGAPVSRSGWKHPAEVATAMRYKRMSEERRKLNVWTRPQER